MREGSYHDLGLQFLQSNPGVRFSAKELAAAVEPNSSESDHKRMAMNGVMLEVMQRHSPHVHRVMMRKPGTRRVFHYWFDDTRPNGVWTDGQEPTISAVLPAVPVSEFTLKTAVDQIESCSFECEAGPLENNVAWRWIREKLAA